MSKPIRDKGSRPSGQHNRIEARRCYETDLHCAKYRFGICYEGGRGLTWEISASARARLYNLNFKMLTGENP